MCHVSCVSKQLHDDDDDDDDDDDVRIALTFNRQYTMRALCAVR